MTNLALKLPGNQNIRPPAGIPSGGLPTVSKVVGNLLTLLLIVVVILSLIFLILGGIQWINSGGDKSKLAAARSRLTYAIIGLIVALASFFIINFLGFLFKVNLLNLG